MLSPFSHVWLMMHPWTVACQAPLSMEFSRQEYWSGLPHPPPGDLPYSGIRPVSFTLPALASGFFTSSTTWEAPVNSRSRVFRGVFCFCSHFWWVTLLHGWDSANLSRACSEVCIHFVLFGLGRLAGRRWHHSNFWWVTGREHVCHRSLIIQQVQSCPTVWPHRWQPTRLLHPWDSPGKNTGAGCHFLLQCIHASQVTSAVSDSFFICQGCWGLLVAQIVKNSPAMQETQVLSLSQEDPLEKEMANHSSILAWEIPWTEKPGRLQSIGLQKFGHDWVSTHFKRSKKVKT